MAIFPTAKQNRLRRPGSARAASARRRLVDVPVQRPGSTSPTARERSTYAKLADKALAGAKQLPHRSPHTAELSFPLKGTAFGKSK